MDIELTINEANNIKKNKHCVGSGVDGSVYDMGHHILYKFYHEMGDFIEIPTGEIYDSDGVNITDIKKLRDKGIRKDHKPINYIDEEGVILEREAAIRKAIEKQKYIKYTNLPKKIIKIDNKVAGCVYKKYDSVLGIYAASFFPLHIRKRILQQLFFKINELLYNNIYPVTLAQKNDIFPFSIKDANVLLTMSLEPVIIDMDGISTFYTDIYSKKKYDQSMSSFSKLLLEILSGIDINENDFADETMEQLIDKKIDEEIIKKYFDYNRLESQDINKLLK